MLFNLQYILKHFYCLEIYILDEFGSTVISLSTWDHCGWVYGCDLDSDLIAAASYRGPNRSAIEADALTQRFVEFSLGSNNCFTPFSVNHFQYQNVPNPLAGYTQFSMQFCFTSLFFHLSYLGQLLLFSYFNAIRVFDG